MMTTLPVATVTSVTEREVNWFVKRVFPNLPEVELVEKPEVRTICFDADALEYEITVKLRANRNPIPGDLLIPDFLKRAARQEG
jgi:hypothetical protein